MRSAVVNLWPVCECGHIAQEHDMDLGCGYRGAGQCPTCGQHTATEAQCKCKKYTGPAWEEFKKQLTAEELQHYGWTQ